MGIRVLGKFEPAAADGFLADDSAIKTADGSSVRDKLGVAIDVTSEQWGGRRGSFKIRISSADIGLKNMYIDSVTVVEDGVPIGKAILNATRLVNDDLNINSNIAINCKIVIKGEKINV